MVISAGAGLFLARFLRPTNFGIYSALVVGIALVEALTNFNLSLHLVTVLRANRGDRVRYAQVMRAAYMVTGPVCVVALACVLGILSGRLRLLASIALVEVAVSPLLLARVGLQVHGRQAGIAGAGVANRVTWALSIAAIVVLRPPGALAWIMLARVVAQSVEATSLALLARLPLLGWFAQAGSGWRVPFRTLKSCLPLAISGLSGLGYNRIDQLLLSGLRGPTQNGLYAAGVQVSEAIGLLPPLIQSVTLPGLVELYRRHDNRGFDAAIADSLLLMLIPAGVGMAVLIDHGGQLATLAFGHAYRGTGAIIAVLAVAEGLTVIGTVYTSAALAVGARGVLARVTVYGLVANVVINVLFIPRYGGLAAAWASLVAYGVTSGLLALGHPELRRSVPSSSSVLARAGIAILLADVAGAVRVVPLAASIVLSCTIYLLACGALMPGQTRRVLQRVRHMRAGESLSEVAEP